MRRGAAPRKLRVICERRVIPVLACEASASQLRVVHITLDFAGRARQFGERAVGVDDGGRRILPALVLEPAQLVAALVLDVAVTIAVAVLVDPHQRGSRVRLELTDELGIAGPALVLVEQDEEERRRVGGAVVGRLRTLVEVYEFAEAQLVEDLAGLLIAERIVLVLCRAARTRRVVRASSGWKGRAW